MCCVILQVANIRLVVIGQSAHHHIEVSLVYFAHYHCASHVPIALI